MSTPAEYLEQLGDPKYIALTTFRRPRSDGMVGAAVVTPVWMVEDGDRLLITTHSALGKVARIRRTPRVTVQACDLRGRVKPDAPRFQGHAEVHEDAASLSTLVRLVRKKYGLPYALVQRLGQLRKSAGDEIAVSVRLTGRT